MMYLLYQFLSFVLCAAIVFTCACRLSASDDSVYWRVRMGYAILGASAAGMVFAPLAGQPPGWLTVLLEFGIVCTLFAGSHRWKIGAPDDVLTGPGALESGATTWRTQLQSIYQGVRMFGLVAWQKAKGLWAWARKRG